MHHKWIEVVSINKKLHGHVSKVRKEKNELLKITLSLAVDLGKSKKTKVSSNVELELLKKYVKMLNSGTSKLDHILTIEKFSGDHFDLGYTSGSCMPKFGGQNYIIDNILRHQRLHVIAHTRAHSVFEKMQKN